MRRCVVCEATVRIGVMCDDCTDDFSRTVASYDATVVGRAIEWAAKRAREIERAKKERKR